MSLKSAQKTDTNLYTLELTCDKERFGAALQKAYEKQKENITVPGFRRARLEGIHRKILRREHFL